MHLSRRYYHMYQWANMLDRVVLRIPFMSGWHANEKQMGLVPIDMYFQPIGPGSQGHFIDSQHFNPFVDSIWVSKWSPPVQLNLSQSKSICKVELDACMIVWWIVQYNLTQSCHVVLGIEIGASDMQVDQKEVIVRLIKCTYRTFITGLLHQR